MRKKLSTLFLYVMTAIMIFTVPVSATIPSFGIDSGSGICDGYDWEDFFKPECPELPEKPECPGIPEKPEKPECPGIPELPEKPDCPGIPELPEKPDCPGIPELPEKPDCPGIPEKPECPEKPEDNSGDAPLYWDYEIISMPGVDNVSAGIESVTFAGSTIGQNESDVTVSEAIEGGSIVIKAKEGYLITSYRIVCGLKYVCFTGTRVNFEGQEEVTVNVSKEDFDHISGKTPYYILISTILAPCKHTVTYEWTGAPEAAVLPVDSGEYKPGETYTVDGTYTAGTVINKVDEYGNVIGTYTFSGWKLCGNIVTGEQKMGFCDVVLEGEWTYEEVELETYTITYLWDDTAPSGEYAQDVPVDSNEYVLNQPYSVDTSYIKGVTTVEKIDENGNVTGKWTFNGWDKEDGKISGNLTITGSWTYEEVELETYTITYLWDDTAPSGEYAQDVPVDSNEYVLNQPYSVDTSYIKGVTTVEKIDENGNVTGKWTFNGWDKEDGKISGNLTITGSWTYEQYPSPVDPVASVYKVEHYLEQEDGFYELFETDFPLYGEIGVTAEVEPNEYKGYTFNEKVSTTSGTIVKATVGEDGEVLCLVLTLYYDLEEKPEEDPEDKTYTVTYIVDGKIYSVKEYSAGDTVKVKDKLEDKKDAEFKGWYYPDNISVKNGKFVMPDEDVVIEGYFKDLPDIPALPEKDGTIKITKELKAPADYDGDTVFTFELYRNGTAKDDLYAIVKVEAGDTVRVKVASGTYYIYEADAEQKGYLLTASCSAKNNKLRVESGKTTSVTFTNVYDEKQPQLPMLEKDDHFGYIIGYPDSTVRPNSNITRAEIATIFFRMLTDESRDYYWSQENDFIDVAREDWFNNAISTLANADILSGYADNTFRPNAPITRAELVKIAVAFYNSDAVIDAEFTDTAGHWADSFINSAYSLGFINGYEDGSFRPDQAVTRAEAMKIINRTLGRYPVADGLHEDMIVWSDNLNKNVWYYADVQEATNSHKYIWISDEIEYWIGILPVRDWAALEKTFSDAYDGK